MSVIADHQTAWREGEAEMKRLMIVCICAMAGLAVGAVGATTASAEVPELGRCVKVEGEVQGKKTIYHGGYNSLHCTHVSAAKTGKYEWTPGPGAANKFTGQAEEPVLETVGGQTVSCANAEFKGEYTGPKTEKLTVSFQVCVNAIGQPCQTTPAKEGEISESQALEGNLAFIAKAKSTAGWDLKREGGEGAFSTYSCGKLPESVHMIEGSVIGQVKGGFFSNLNKMDIHSLVGYKAKHGVQAVEAFEGLPKDTLTTTTTGLETRGPEQTGLKTLAEVDSGLGKPIEEPANQEPLEIKTK
jgi:hypothetical protein